MIYTRKVLMALPAIVTSRRGRALSVVSLLVFAATALALVSPPRSAQAAFGIGPGTFSVTTSNQQAGGHPDLTVSFVLNTTTDSFGFTVPDGDIRDVEVDLPPGLVGNPVGVPRCPADKLQAFACPPSTQVGVSTTTTLMFGSEIPQVNPVFNLKPDPGQTAKFGFMVGNVAPVILKVKVRPDDYGLTTSITNISAANAVKGSSLTLWGVPADPSHDGERFKPNPVAHSYDPGPTPTDAPRAPFIINPTKCGVALQASIRADSWQYPGQFDTATATMPAISGCQKLSFKPSIAVQPSSTAAGVPAGYTIDLEVPQNDDPDGLATANLKDAIVTLPPGVALSPSAADGLQGCTDAEFGLGSDQPPGCPDASKIGHATLTTPLLPDQLEGAIYVGTQQPGDPYRIFIVISGDGVVVKLRGSIHADPTTGQLTAKFLDNPQQPFSDLKLEFKGGPRAVLANPTRCGVATSTAQLTPYGGGNPMDLTDSFGVSFDGEGAPCPNPAPFAADFLAGTTNPLAGRSSTFVLRLARNDSEQEFRRLTVDLPPGLSGKVAGVPLCPADQAAAGTCDQSSQIGTTQVAAGPGSHPLFLGGKVFLTGPYNGAPFGLSIVVPAIAGPYDLGTVVVRAAVYVDPVTAQLHVVSDELPTILQGIPLRLRDIRIVLDRPGFMVNPTNCLEQRVHATVDSVGGAVATQSSRFEVDGCHALKFSPKLSVRARGSGRRGSHPSLSVTLTQGSGQANLKSVLVKLPRTLGPDLNGIQNLCKLDDFRANKCEAKTIAGSASAVTPLLSEPLKGTVYLVQVSGDSLPEIGVKLRGQLTIDLLGKVSFATKAQNVTTTFGSIPDVPVSKFALTLNGGKSKGILTALSDLCAKRQTASVRLASQAGHAKGGHSTISVDGCRKRKRSHARH